IGLVQPVELRGTFDSERVQQQHHLRQIAPLNFRRVALRAIQMPALRPESPTVARRSPPCPALALIGRRAADRFEEECADSALGIVTRHARDSAIDYMKNAVDGHGSFG